jgi:hypothetical protein
MPDRLTDEQLASLATFAQHEMEECCAQQPCMGHGESDVVLALIAEVRELRAASLSAGDVAQLRAFVEANAGNDDREALAPVLRRLGIDLPPFEL